MPCLSPGGEKEYVKIPNLGFPVEIQVVRLLSMILEAIQWNKMALLSTGNIWNVCRALKANEAWGIFFLIDLERYVAC